MQRDGTEQNQQPLLHELTDAELLARVDSVAVSSRTMLANLLRFLLEVERRDLHLKEACSSLAEFCRRKLQLTPSEGRRRARVVRVAKSFPIVIDLIASGDLSLSSIERVAKRLTKENHRELLSAITNKTQDEVTDVLARRFPNPDVSTNVRHHQTVKPTHRQRLSGESYRVGLTMSREMMAKLERATRRLSHRNPTLDFVTTLEWALDELLAKLDKEVLGKADAPRPEKPTKDNRLSRAGRRTAYERDGEQCSYTSVDGTRCDGTSFLEVDHVEPKGRGGSGDSTNTRILCRAHNQFLARETYGSAFVQSRIAERRSAAKSSTLPTTLAKAVARPSTTSASSQESRASTKAAGDKKQPPHGGKRMRR